MSDKEPQADDVDMEVGAPSEKDGIEASGTPMMQSMAIKDSVEQQKNSRWWWLKCRHRDNEETLRPYQRLVTEKSVRDWSIGSLRFAILATAVAIKILQPNYAIMAAPGVTPDSFESTDPFDFNTATYFIPMTGQLGVTVSSIFAGRISDKRGRKPVLLVSTILAGGGSILKYFLRNTFWGFNAANFVTGIFSGTLPVAMAYVGDVFTTEREKQSELGLLVGYWVLGSSGGGIIAILMESTGLFMPLWVAAGAMFIAAYFLWRYCIEPGDVRLLESEPKVLEEDEDIAERPETIDQCALWNIVGGALMDNIGSTSLFPLCLSPLALNQYLTNFTSVGEEPIMTITGYKWLSVMVALMVVPSTAVCPWIFRKIGIAAACVFGNVATAIVTIALLLTANGPATNTFFAVFVFFMYSGYPFTVVSQLTTGPMLDYIAPNDKRGFVQGLNSMVMNLGLAFSPWVFGIMADAVGTNTAIWTGIGCSFAAGLVNAPLMFRKGFGPVPKKPPAEARPLKFEDKEVVEKILRGEYVPISVLIEVNQKREAEGQPVLVAHSKPYEDEKDQLDELSRGALVDFQFRKQRLETLIAAINDPEQRDELPEFCDRLNAAIDVDPELASQVNSELGQWFADYLADNGYAPHIIPTLVKQMVMSAFPPITKDKQFTPENTEEIALHSRSIYLQYIQL